MSVCSHFFSLIYVYLPRIRLNFLSDLYFSTHLTSLPHLIGLFRYRNHICWLLYLFLTQEDFFQMTLHFHCLESTISHHPVSPYQYSRHPAHSHISFRQDEYNSPQESQTMIYLDHLFHLHLIILTLFIIDQVHLLSLSYKSDSLTVFYS